jgi:hypothetical protein
MFYCRACGFVRQIISLLENYKGVKLLFAFYFF